ncbi:hypothetical protein GBAR_LOCUS19938 [Geodia barretti]|uniref:Uncharacterized protein n=1 Tax=Geodia barretti TaxID=519541 RepID=A0AA35SUK1_GEOBA|nr:hypothetical protein GBAR_LOCUS19938 [Geodia barretti]
MYSIVLPLVVKLRETPLSSFFNITTYPVMFPL